MELNIKEIRKKAMFSQEEFAKELGVTTCTVQRWESDKSKPHPKHLRKITEFCKNHNIPLEWGRINENLYCKSTTRRI